MCIGRDVLSLGLPTLHIAPFFLYSQTKHLADLENASGQEQYYEIPHWMHLSFVSYQSDDAVFVDHLVEADDAKPDRALHDNKSGPVILSNGFLLSNTADPSRDADRSISPLLCAKSSTLLTDEKLLTDSHQRKLIDGRDFRDILEACRPRYAGTIPSALRAALNIDFGSFSSHNESMEQGASGSHGELEEWGTVHSDQMRTECGASATGQPATEERNDCVQLSVSPRNSFGSFDDGEDDRANDVSSHASSIASAMMYMSSDRSTYRELQVSPSTSIVELQRSNSLILDNGGDYVVLENGPSTNHIDESSILAERLRDMMRSHDENSINFSSLKSDVTFESIERDPGDSVKQQSGLTLRQRLIDGSHGASNGGLGFALSHFEQPTASWMTSATQGPSLSRTSSMIGTTRNIGVVSSRRMADLGSRGLSPMLLPSVVPTSYLHQTDTTSVALDTNRTSHGPMENRFINPQDYSKGRSIGFRPSARAFGAKSDTRLRAGTRSLSVSPPTSKSIGSPPRDTFHRPKPSHEERFQSKNNSPHNGSQPPFRAGMASRKKKMFNPFRQQDEEEVLAMKSHNRRRWSHVFPLGEIEFKRHAGPNWKSLTAPAILPISIDYFPNQEEIDREFTFSSYNVTLSEFDHKNYASNQDLYVEMVRQRLTQDFQVVSEDCINASLYRREKHPKGGSNGRVSSTDGTSHPQALRQFLSMGHRLHVITYDPSADMIEVYRYDDKDTQNNVTFDYHYLAFCQETKRYGKTRQTFSKYSAPYNWNKVDNIICGDDDREMREGMRFKRVMFGIIPEDFGGDLDVEEAYVLKFRRFLEYLEKLRDKEESITPLNVKFVTSADKLHQEESKRMESTPGVERNSMIRFYMQLRKGKRDNLEWMELAIDSTFDTSWSYRIMFNWLVASSGKVDAQVQLLQRRCSQFGLKLVPFPQITLSRNLYLNPFKAPAVLSIARNVGGLQLENVLSRLGFVHDGVFYTEVGAVLECMDNASLFNFQKVNERPILTPRMLPKLGHREKLTPLVEPISTRKKFCPVMGKQVVHRSGTLFVRVLTDLNGLCVLVVLGNYRYLTSSKEESLSDSYRSAFRSLVERISALEEHFFRDG